MMPTTVLRSPDAKLVDAETSQGSSCFIIETVEFRIVSAYCLSAFEIVASRSRSGKSASRRGSQVSGELR